MKKITLLLLFTALLSYSYAQLPDITADGASILGQTMEVAVTEIPGEGDELKFEALVTNPLTEAMPLGVNIYVLEEVPGTLNFFCYSQCWAPGMTHLDISNVEPIAAGASVEFSSHYMPMLQAGTTMIQYVFYNENNDSVWFNVRFSVNVGGGSLPNITAGGSSIIGQTIDVTVAEIPGEGDELKFEALVTNKGTEDLPLGVKVNVLEEVAGSLNFFCYYKCWAPGTILLNIRDIDPLPAGVSVDFSSHYMPLLQPGITTIQYVFFNENNDSVWFNVKYSVAVEGIEDVNKVETSVYPNPVTSLSSISFNLPSGTKEASLYIYSLTGIKVREYALTSSDTKVFVNANELNAGMYIYSIFVNGKRVSSDKFVVR